ncbi:PAS domain-containing protein [Mycobacterium sp. SMC-18]|uniref:PAS domain-containing protein n=1 Tax=Mycobacterium sp. SMC-18 TaxID=3381629 RepID=UPI0038769506
MAEFYALVGIDTGSIITYWSDGAERLFGHRRAEVMGQNLAIIIPEEHREAHRVGFSAAMQKPTISDVHLDVPTMHADGRKQEYPVRLMVVMDAFGVALGALAVFSSSGVVGIPLY